MRAHAYRRLKLIKTIFSIVDKPPADANDSLDSDHEEDEDDKPDDKDSTRSGVDTRDREGDPVT